MRRRISFLAAFPLVGLLALGASVPALADAEPVAQIAGTILDENGDGAAGFTVVASTNGNTQYGQGVTDDDGHYSISGLTPATFNVYVSRPCCVPTSEWPYRDLGYRQVTVVSSEATVANDYQLKPLPTGSASLSGVIKDKVTGDPIPGVRVDLMYSSDGYYMSQIPSVTTDANGAYSFSNLAPSDAMPGVTLSFSKQGLYYSKSLSPTIGSAAILRNTTLTPMATGTGSVSGTVRLSTGAEFSWGNINLATAGWRPVGSSVTLDTAGAGLAHYSFDNLPTGDYNLSLSVPGGASRFIPISVIDGAATTENIVVAAYEVGDAFISGSIVDARTGQPVAGAPVSLQPVYGQNNAYQNVYSESDGTWRFEGVADGDYSVYTSAWSVSPPVDSLGWEGYQPPIEIEIVNGVGVADVAFEFRSFIGGDAVLDGRVRDSATHLPVVGATISLIRSASGTDVGQWQTDSTGTFAADGLSDGDYYVTVEKDGYRAGNASVLVSGGHASVVVPIIPLGSTTGLFSDGEISVTVYDTEGDRVDDARVDGSQPALDADNWVSFDEWVDEQGEITLTDLLGGQWLIHASAQSSAGYRIFAPQHVEISETHPTVELEFHESVGSRITGHVDLNGFPASELVIGAYDETGYWLSTGTVLDDGTYEITDLPEGDLYLALQGGQMGYQGGQNASTADIWAVPVYSTGGGTGQTADFGDADPFVLTGGQLITGVDFTAVAGGSARADLALHSVGASAPLPASRCIEMTVYRRVGSTWTVYAPGFSYSCGDKPLLATGLPSGQYKFKYSDTLAGSTSFRTTYNGDALSLAAAPAVVVTAGQLTDLGTVTVSVPEPDQSSLEALDLDFLASDPGFDLSAYEDQVTTDDEPTAGDETEIEVGEEFAGQWVNVSLNSTPVVVGATWHQVAADGTVTVTLPGDVDGSHRLAVGDASGQLIGWTAVEIAEGTSTGGSTGGSGGSSGTSAAPKPSTGIGKVPAAAAGSSPTPTANAAAAATPEPAEEPGAAPATEQEQTASDAPSGDLGWLPWAIGGGLVVLVGAAGALIFIRRAV